MFAGIDIGGTNIKAGVIDAGGELLWSDSHPTDAARGKDALIEDIQSVMGRTLAAYPKLQSVGVGFPSVVHPDGSVHHPPNLPGWGVVPLRDILQSALPVPVAIDNDANVAALAESELGAGASASHFLYVTLGTGVGGGIIINKRIYSGERGGAGEIGHIIVDANDAPTAQQVSEGRAFRAGTLEELVGRPGLLAMARHMMAEYPDSLLHSYGNELDVEQISEATAAGDPCAEACFRRAGYVLGVGIAGALAMLDMRIVVVGGGISKAHPLLLDTTLATLRSRALPTIAHEVELRLAQFSTNAGIIGAALLGKGMTQDRTTFIAGE
ncbi:MAG: ROK family protein [Candidatus Kapabacteria bacterium]|nr:ROK family protein [Candidatus Kapabacteria bacterium]